MSDHPEISIVIVSWNVRELLDRCLASIDRYVTIPHEVVVVDNHSHDGTIDTLRRDYPRILTIANQANLGFARGNNQGWQLARGQYVCFLNPDTELIDDPFPELLGYLQQHPTVGCIAPELLTAERQRQPSIRGWPTFSDQFLILLKLRWLARWLPPLKRYYAQQANQTHIPLDVPQVMGAAMVLPRTVLERHGTFDEGYWIWFEEVDLCRRLHQSGLSVVYDPRAHIVHLGGQSFAQHLTVAKHVWFLRSLWRYAHRYWSTPAQLGLIVLLPISYLLTMLQSLIKPR